jgi:hypothetical protein
MALLTTPSERSRAEWALLEKFKECLDPHDARQIAGEHRGEEIKTLDRYMECIQALERKSGTMVLVRQSTPTAQLLTTRDEKKHYEAYEQAEKKGKKHPPQGVNMIQQQSGMPGNAPAAANNAPPNVATEENGGSGPVKGPTVRCNFCNIQDMCRQTANTKGGRWASRPIRTGSVGSAKP